MQEKPEKEATGGASSGAATCSISLPQTKVIWKWWTWSNDDLTWQRMEGMGSHETREDAEINPPRTRRIGDTYLIIKEVTLFSE